MRTLIFCKCEDGSFGIWQAGRIVRFTAGDLHWLSSRRPHIAGLTIVNNRSCPLFDLPAALGLAPVSRKADRFHVLLLRKGRESIGLLLPPNIHKGQVDPATVLPLPGFLASSLQKTWLPLRDGPLPILETQVLLDIIVGRDFAPPRPGLKLARRTQADLPVPGQWVFIKAGGFVFAVPQQALAFRPAASLAIHPVARAPEYLHGMARIGRQILPVIRLAQLMQLAPAGPATDMLVTRIGDDRFGFEIEDHLADPGSADTTIKPLSNILCTPWMHNGVVQGRDVRPVLDLPVLLSKQGRLSDSTAITQRKGSPGDRDIMATYGRQPLEVVAFDICQQRLCLPKSHVGDIRPFEFPQPIAVRNRLVAGMLPAGETIIPVLDPAVCYGFYSTPDPNWHLIRVRCNGIEACLMAEVVRGSHELSPGQLRELPYEATAGVLYGCYPEEGQVRLILNLEALIHLFENDHGTEPLKRFRRINPSQAPAPEAAPTRPAPHLSDARIDEPPPSRAAEPDPGAALPEPNRIEPERGQQRGTTGNATETPRQKPVMEAAPAIRPERIGTPQPHLAAWLDKLRLLAFCGNADGRPRAEDPVLALAEPVNENDGSVSGEDISGTRAPSQPTAPPIEQVPLAAVQAEPGLGTDHRVKSVLPEIQVADGPVPDRSLPLPQIMVASNLPPQPHQRQLLTHSAGTAPVEAVGLDDGPSATASGSVLIQGWPFLAPSTSDDNPSDPPDPERQVEPVATPAQRRLTIPVYLTLAILFFSTMALILWHALDSNRFARSANPAITRRILKPDAPADGSRPPQTLQSPSGSNRQPQFGPLRSTEDQSAPPAPGHKSSSIYRVKEGDTLWSISERFTGSGFNYDRLARDNEIENPDRIYPSQQIEVK